MKELFESHRVFWDKPEVRSDARTAIQKMLDCQTSKLGGRIYESETGEQRCFFNTCGSKVCTSCGVTRTKYLQQRVEAWLPDVPYNDIGLGMPDFFWLLFRQNRHLLRFLPEIAAGVLQDWARSKYGADIVVIVVPQTFGGRFNFQVHFHILVSTFGLNRARNNLVKNVFFPVDAISQGWRHALMDYLTMALDAHLISSDLPNSELRNRFKTNRDSWWKTWIDRDVTKTGIFQYISRYVLRPPIAQHKLLPSDDPSVIQFVGKDTKAGDQNVPMSMPASDFFALFVDHLADRYRHGIRYFGLLAPRCSGSVLSVFLALLGQKRRQTPKRVPWRVAVWTDFGRDPLADSNGHTMRRVGHIPL